MESLPEDNELRKPLDSEETGHAGECSALESGGGALAEVPSNLPVRVLAGDALARQGLSELAKQPARVESLEPGPWPLHGHCVVSDEAHERVLLLGGWSNDRIWSFEFTWTIGPLRRWHNKLAPRRFRRRFRPDSIGHPAVVLDAQRHRLIWFGGWPPGDDRPVDELYVLDLTRPEHLQWDFVEHQHPWPLPRYGASLVLDSKRDRCLLFGGNAGPGKSFRPLCDLWTRDLGTLTWTRVKDRFWKPRPAARWLHAAAVDMAGDRMVLFGGSKRSLSQDPAFHLLDLASLRWKEVRVSGDGPPPVEGHAMVYVPELNAVFVYGGLLLEGRGPSSLPYLWRCDLSTWQGSRVELPAAGQPRGRFCHAACYCRHRRALFCVGGKWNRTVGNYYETLGELSDTFMIHLA
ncbi:MAG: kelch repeat-containing protein [Planctomycetota bacterium]